MKVLLLGCNQIDDDGVAILVDVLRSNKSLTDLDLWENDEISKQGKIMLLKLVNDVSSTNKTLQSNHTLKDIDIIDQQTNFFKYQRDEIQRHINVATSINWQCRESNSEAAGKAKIIQTQLHSERRVELCRLQNINLSLFSQIDPRHLPEVLSLTGRHHKLGDLYDALSLSIMSLLSTSPSGEYIHKKRPYHAVTATQYNAKVDGHMPKVQELDNEPSTMEEITEGTDGNNDVKHREKKRRD